MKKSTVVIFASGSGSNAENIAQYFKEHQTISVKKIYTNNPNAGVIKRMYGSGIPVEVFDKKRYHALDFIEELKTADLIVLAGFLWLIPASFVENFPNKIINVHPALLPKYGGKGMYGMHVHEAVVKNKEKETGITIHYVNEQYDEGKIILQASCNVGSADTPEDVAHKIHKLEFENFPKAIENILSQKS